MSDSTNPPGQPRTARATKANASYPSGLTAPHTFRASTSPDGTVTLTVHQDYTGKQEKFRFDEDQWDQLVNAEFQRRAARVVNEWHEDDLSADAVSHLADLVPDELVPWRFEDEPLTGNESPVAEF